VALAVKAVVTEEAVACAEEACVLEEGLVKTVIAK